MPAIRGFSHPGCIQLNEAINIERETAMHNNIALGTDAFKETFRMRSDPDAIPTVENLKIIAEY